MGMGMGILEELGRSSGCCLYCGLFHHFDTAVSHSSIACLAGLYHSDGPSEHRFSCVLVTVMSRFIQ
jgi:hypothetical protein